MQREDWLERQVRLMAQALARILGLRKEGRNQAAIEECASAMAQIGGMDPKLLDAIGAAAAARQIGDPRRVAALARLACERAAVETAAGDLAAAARHRALALELWREAAAAGVALDPEDRARVEELARGAGGAGPP